jgi:rhodanese-related sulfurtransferase
MRSLVTLVEAASGQETAERYERRLRFETDCADVYGAITNGVQDFILVDVRSQDLYNASHLPNAVNIPHRKLTEEGMREHSRDTLYVVYCAGPHCNGTDRAAAKLGRLGFRVKVMIGGMTGWNDEGFPFVKPNQSNHS